MPVPQRLTPPEPAPVKTASWTCLEEDHGRVFIVGGADLVATLPAVSASNTGLTFHFVVRVLGGSVGFSVSPAAADALNGGTDDKDLQNTAATDVVLDGMSVVSDGVTGWAVYAVQGVWAEES